MATARVKRVREVMPLGRNWGSAVQKLVMQTAVAQARFNLASGKRARKDEVEVVIPVSVHITFPRNGKEIEADGGAPGCVCTFKQDESGSVCICVGPGAASCDCTPIHVKA